MAKNRDNFSESVKRLLKDRVAHRCSNPSCRVPTISPRGKDNTNSIGIAAHICAASKGGPRYDEGMSVEQRKSIENAIWLCANCSIKIDKDVGKYPVELLHDWKTQAEKISEEEMGQKLPDKNDAINMLSAALTGSSMKFLSQAIANTHRASSKVLEDLDSRFSVKSKYINDTSSFELIPREDIDFSIDIIGPEAIESFVNGHKALIEHGQEFTISTDSIEARGSKLLEYIAGRESGIMSISPIKKPAVYRICIVNKETNAHTYLEDIRGYVKIGTKSFTFFGTALDGMLSFSNTFNLEKRRENAKLTIDFERWNGRSIHNLKYFNKLFAFFDEAFKNNRMTASLDVDGEHEINGLFEDPSRVQLFQQVYSQLTYIYQAREVCVYLNEDLKFRNNTSLDAEHIAKINRIYKTIKGTNKFGAENQKSVAKITLSAKGAKEQKEYLFGSKPLSMRIIEPDEEKIELFGKLLTLPEKVYTLENVKLEIIGRNAGRNIDDINDVDSIEVECIPAEKYLCSITYLKPDDIS